MRWHGSGFSQPPEDEPPIAYLGDDRIVEIDFYVGTEPQSSGDDEIAPGWLTL